MWQEMKDFNHGLTRMTDRNYIIYRVMPVQSFGHPSPHVLEHPGLNLSRLDEAPVAPIQRGRQTSESTLRPHSAARDYCGPDSRRGRVRHVPRRHQYHPDSRLREGACIDQVLSAAAIKPAPPLSLR